MYYEIKNKLKDMRNKFKKTSIDKSSFQSFPFYSVGSMKSWPL